MPFYVGDYIADTRRLSTLEHGAYILLICEYWRNGKLPKDDNTLARIVGLTAEEWQCVRNAVASMFACDWTHKRIEEERKKSDERTHKAKKSASIRWKDKIKRKMRTHAPSNAPAMLTTTTTILESSSLRSEGDPTDPTPSPEKIQRPKKSRTSISSDAQPTAADTAAALKAGLVNGQFREQWQKFRDYHLARGQPMADWSAAWRTWLGNMKQFGGRNGNGQAKRGSLVDAGITIVRGIDERERNLWGETGGDVRDDVVRLLSRR